MSAPTPAVQAARYITDLLGGNSAKTSGAYATWRATAEAAGSDFALYVEPIPWRLVVRVTIDGKWSAFETIEPGFFLDGDPVRRVDRSVETVLRQALTKKWNALPASSRRAHLLSELATSWASVAHFNTEAQRHLKALYDTISELAHELQKEDAS